jgi:hypothetical protein
MAVLPSVDLSQAMLTVKQLLRRIAGFDSPLLITGEYPYSQKADAFDGVGKSRLVTLTGTSLDDAIQRLGIENQQIWYTRE